MSIWDHVYEVTGPIHLLCAFEGFFTAIVDIHPTHQEQKMTCLVFQPEGGYKNIDELYNPMRCRFEHGRLQV